MYYGFEEMKQLTIMETIFGENVRINEKEIDNKVFIEVVEIERTKQMIFDPRDTSVKLGKKEKTRRKIQE
jgi:hypothetical protein